MLPISARRAALGGEAVVPAAWSQLRLIASRRHATATSAKREIPSVVVGLPVEVEHVTCQVVTIVLAVCCRILLMKDDEIDAGVPRRHVGEIP